MLYVDKFPDQTSTTYYEAITINKSLTINGAGNNKVTIDGGTCNLSAVNISANNVTLNNITVMGGCAAYSSTEELSYAGAIMYVYSLGSIDVVRCTPSANGYISKVYAKFQYSSSTVNTGEGVDFIAWDNNSGMPGTELGRVNVPASDIKWHDNGEWSVADFSPLWINISSDFFVGWDTVSPSDIYKGLSDSGTTGSGRSKYYDGIWKNTNYDWIIKAEVGLLPYTPNVAGILVCSVDATVVDCNITQNYYGIQVNSSAGVTTYHNNLFLNAINGFDEGASNYTYNWWDSYDESSEGAWDNNSDNIADSPYNLTGGSNQDAYPLMNAWNGSEFLPLPVLSGETPANSSESITTTPSLNVFCTSPAGGQLTATWWAPPSSYIPGISFGSEYEFTNVTATCTSISSFNSTCFVVAYENASGYGNAVIGTVDGTSVSYGSVCSFGSGGMWYIDVAVLDSTHFVVVYTPSSAPSLNGIARIGTVSGNTISFGAEYVFNAIGTYETSVTALDSTHFAVSYRDAGSSQYSASIIGTVSGSVISYGSEYFFATLLTNYISTSTLDSTHFVIAFRYSCFISNGIAIIATISNDNEISYSSGVFFNPADSYYVSVATLDPSHFVVVYQDDPNSEYGTACIGTVSEDNDFSFGSEYVFNSATTYYTSVSALDSKHFVVSYEDNGNSNYGTAVIGTVSGTTISYGSEYVFNAADTFTIDTISLDYTHFVTSYKDSGNSDYGTTCIGETDGGSSWTQFASNATFPINTNISQTNSAFSDYLATYYWRVVLSSDNGKTTTQTYHFTTGEMDTSVDAISTYEQGMTPLSITATDVLGGGLDGVSLYYSHSSDNITFSSWTKWVSPLNPDSSSPWQWSFNFPSGDGYYKFYSKGSYGETFELSPVVADTECAVWTNYSLASFTWSPLLPSTGDTITLIDLSENATDLCWMVNNVRIAGATYSSGSHTQFNTTVNLPISNIYNVSLRSHNDTNGGVAQNMTVDRAVSFASGYNYFVYPVSNVVTVSTFAQNQGLNTGWRVYKYNTSNDEWLCWWLYPSVVSGTGDDFNISLWDAIVIATDATLTSRINISSEVNTTQTMTIPSSKYTYVGWTGDVATSTALDIGLQSGDWVYKYSPQTGWLAFWIYFAGDEFIINPNDVIILRPSASRDITIGGA